MKNILKDTPQTRLNARLAQSMAFVAKSDIEGKKILDIGCGYGWFEVYALENKVKEITGIEISPLDLKTAKKYIKDKRATFFVAGATKIPLKNNSINTVVSWEVIEHIPKGTESKMFQEVSRVLTKGGSFYLSTPYGAYRSKIGDPAWWLIGHRHYTKEILTKLGNQNGFKIKKIITKGGYFSIALMVNMYIAKWLFHRQPFLYEYFLKKELEEYRREGFHEIFIHYVRK